MKASSRDTNVAMSHIQVPPIPPRTNVPVRETQTTPNRRSLNIPDRRSPSVPDRRSLNVQYQVSPPIPDRRSPNNTERRSPNIPERGSPISPERRSPNIHEQRSPRESPSSHCNDRTTSPNHVRQSSGTSSNRSVDGHSDDTALQCPAHPLKRQTFVCRTCVQPLCEECVDTENSKHRNCCVTRVGDHAHSVCNIVKYSLITKMGETKSRIADLLETLSKKKDRTISKRNETVTEVERFYQRLKAKLLAKLQREENQLLNYLNQTVAEQARELTEKINQCSKLTREINQKEGIINNIDHVHSANNNAPERLKSLLNGLAGVNQDSEAVEEITAARDAFLVIRFIIDPESEQRIVNTKFAAVEVLDSRANSPSEESSERQLIDEALNSTGAETSSVHDIVAIDHCEEEQYNPVITGPTNTADNVCASESNSTDAGPVFASSNFDETTTNEATDIAETSLTNTQSDREGDEEPPPPYPGLPSHVPEFTLPSEPPPPYPGHPPPPAYAQHPEPQQPHVQHFQVNRPHARSRSEGAAVSGDRCFDGRSTPSHVLLPELSNPSTIASPTINRIRVPLKVFSVNEISDKRSSGIFSMAVFNENSFLIIDRWNRKLKFFSETGESMGGVLFREEPWDIAKITHEMFAVTVPKLQIIYKIKASSQAVVTVGNIGTLKKYACICYHGTSDMLVCGQVPQFGEPCIDVIGANGGPILLSFRANTMGQDLFSYPRYVKVSDDGTVIVCDWNLKCLLLFKLDGTVVGRYKGDRDFKLNDPTGIEIDRESNKLFVIDAKENSSAGSVQKLSLNCQCEEVFRVQNDFRDARAVVMYGSQRMAIGNKNGILTIFSTRSRYR